MSLAQIAAIAILVVGAVIALWVLIKSSRGTPRVLAIIATVLILLGVLGGYAYQWMVERFFGRVDDDKIVSILAADTAIGGLLIGVGLILLVRAIVVANRMPKL